MSLPLYQPFTNEWITFELFFLAILALIGSSEVLRVYAHWSPEASRKVVHVIVGVMVSASPLIFTTKWPPVTMAVLFIIINYFALKSHRFRGMHATNRISYGTVWFPITFLILALFWWHRPVTLIIAMLLMTFADTFAAIAGQTIKPSRMFTLWSDSKTVIGSVTMFMVSYLIIFVVTISLSWYTQLLAFYPFIFILKLSVFLALMATVTEAVSRRGSDNFSVPMTIAVLYDIGFIRASEKIYYSWMAWVVFSLVLFLLAYKFKALSASGTAGGFVMGVVIFGIGGWQWITPLLVFFLLSSLLSRLGGKPVSNRNKGSNRDIIQVFANGGVALVLAIIYFYTHWDFAYPLFLGVIAAATADTWATEIGYFSRKKPWHILSGRPVERGTSGGVTVLGTTGSLAGAATIGFTGFLFGISGIFVFLVIIAGFAGSLIDSILGGSVQGMFRSPIDGALTEKRYINGAPTEHVMGWKWVDNDMVNLLNTVSAAMIVGGFLFWIV